jgi:hypothetical protein
MIGSQALPAGVDGDGGIHHHPALPGVHEQRPGGSSGGAVQVDPIKPVLKAPKTKRFEIKS